MGIFNFFKRKTEARSQVKENHRVESPVQRGVAMSKKIELNSQSENSIRNCVIAFDVETTGLSPTVDRIVEIGAVIFKNGTVSKVFSSLVNPGVSISSSASAINHITNTMLATAPSERLIYPRLVEFLGDALCGKIIMCAHNAKFDFDFLCNTLSRLGYNANIEYVDTLNLSRQYLRGLENHKQSTIEKHFKLVNPSSHRAATDAENCGHILFRILDVAKKNMDKETKKNTTSKLDLQELEVCAYIQNIISQRGGDIALLRFNKNSSGYVDVSCLYNFLRMKFARKGNYILMKNDIAEIANYIVEPCTQSEGGTDNIRVYFSSPFDLESLSDYIYAAFDNSYKSMKQYVSYSNSSRQELESSVGLMCALSNEDVSALLNNAKEHKFTPTSIISKPIISRDDVVISPTHSRVPLNEIQNAKNWDKGFKLGMPYWEKGEEERKKGNYSIAIELFDKARLYGYAAPDLYDSYAMVYRKLKDYDNEITILDEAISRMPDQSSAWEARRNKAINLLFARQEGARKTAEKINHKSKKEIQKVDSASITKKPRGRIILQMDDDGHVIKEFDTVSAAGQEVGVSPKSIRDAAIGVQKHAGGYRWMYKE